MTAISGTVPPPPPTADAAGKGSNQRRRRIGEKWYTPYLFLLPHFLLFAVFVGAPFFYGFYVSLFDFDFVRPDSPFVGLQNYANLVDATSIHFDRFWATLVNTFLFVIISTPLQVASSLGLAIMLNRRFRGRNLFRGIYFAPWTLSVAVIGLLWWWILSSQIGLVTSIFHGFGLDSPPWLTENPWAWISIIVATLWWTVGYNMIILLAGLQAISPELYEAAAIDGANGREQFRHITLPSLRPILLLVITLQVIAGFQVVGQPQIITGGGPGIETTPVLLYVLNVGFAGRYELGQAAAMALVVALIMIVVSVINFRVLRTEAA